jgi:hypothetical protein
MNCDLEAILLEDLRRWMEENNVEPVAKQPTEEERRDKAVAEDVIEEAEQMEDVVVEEKAEQIQEKVDDQDDRKGEEEELMEDVQTTDQQAPLDRERPNPEVLNEEVIIIDEEVVTNAEPVDQPIAEHQPQPEPPERSSTPTKWARFAAHWRLFTPFVQHNTNA